MRAAPEDVVLFGGVAAAVAGTWFTWGAGPALLLVSVAVLGLGSLFVIGRKPWR